MSMESSWSRTSLIRRGSPERRWQSSYQPDEKSKARVESEAAEGGPGSGWEEDLFLLNHQALRASGLEVKTYSRTRSRWNPCPWSFDLWRGPGR